MSNIYDYVTWRGDLSFAERPFNELDNLVLCQLSYIDMSKAFPAGEIISAGDLIRVLLERGQLNTLVADGQLRREEYTAFARAAADSERFGKLLMSDYVDILDEEQQIQFSAVTFRINKDTAFIAFRGTDSSLVGWKEDFMLSFEKIRAQEEALQYVRRQLHGRESGTAAEPENREAGTPLRYYIGGHSKGANLALYAACLLTQEERERILHVYVNDGPGLCADVMDLSVMEQVDPITTKIVPEYDVIGKIFEMPVTDNRIVRSSDIGIMQHGIITWQLRDGALDLVPENDPGSIWIGHVMDQWIGGVSNMEDRKTFIDELFDTIGAGGIRDFNEMSALGPDGLERILGAAAGISPITREVARALPVTAVIGKRDDASRLQSLWNRLRESVFARSVALIVTGLGAVALPQYMLPATMAVVLAVFVALELIYTVRRFREVHGDMKAMQVQTYICIAGVAVYLMILIKDNALMLLSNVIFGVIFLFLAYHIVDRMKQTGRRTWRWYWSFAEAVLLGGMGAAVLLVPESTIWAVTFVGGLLFLIDGLVHLADAIRLRQGIHPRAGKGGIRRKAKGRETGTKAHAKETGTGAGAAQGQKREEQEREGQCRQS